MLFRSGLLEAESQGRIAETLPELRPHDFGIRHVDIGQEFAFVPTECSLEIQPLERPQEVRHVGVEVAQFVDAIPTVDAGGIAKFFAQAFQGHTEVDLERVLITGFRPDRVDQLRSGNTRTVFAQECDQQMRQQVSGFRVAQNGALSLCLCLLSGNMEEVYQHIYMDYMR